MFNNLTQFLKDGVSLERSQDNKVSSRELQIATVAVLAEAARANSELQHIELVRVLGTLFREFGLSDHDGMELLEIAEFLRKEHGRCDEFFSALNHNFSVQQREHVLCLVWRVLLADGRLDTQEASFAAGLRKLLGLSPEQAVRAQRLAQEPLPKIESSYQDPTEAE
jgi:uncharacterized tellurite resistance protein B-like protein